MIQLFNDDNMNILPTLPQKYTVAYADMIYEDLDFSWVIPAVQCLVPDGVLMVQTDNHSVAEMKLYLDRLGLTFVNWCIYKQEWGGVSKRRFPRKHDDILIYARSSNYKFYYERVLIPKATAGTAFDKRGDGLKIPCDVFDDLGNFLTTSKERVKLGNNKNVQWQKPLKLMDRLLLPFTDGGDWVLDPFMGVGTTMVWCKNHGRNGTGIELDEIIYGLAEERINGTTEYAIKELN